MALATYKDLCIDANDPGVVGSFWAGALELTLEVRDDGQTLLTGPTPQHTVWINQVPEPRTVKQRVHLDVNAASITDVAELGAQELDVQSFPWALMADPEGGELCVFERVGPIERRLYEVVFDTPDSPDAAHATATWWGELLGATVQRDDERGFSWVEDVPGAPFDGLVFGGVPEPKTVKNRIHLDLVAPSIEAVLDHGATLLHDHPEEGWAVLADPDGNELCVFTAARIS